MAKQEQKADNERQVVQMKSEIDRIAQLLQQAHDFAKGQQEQARKLQESESKERQASAKASEQASAKLASEPKKSGRKRIERDANGLITAIVDE
jgi:hypothetical protein